MLDTEIAEIIESWGGRRGPAKPLEVDMMRINWVERKTIMSVDRSVQKNECL